MRTHGVSQAQRLARKQLRDTGPLVVLSLVPWHLAVFINYGVPANLGINFIMENNADRAGSHEVWRHSQTGRKVTIPHHATDMAERTLRAILREAGIDVSDFLRA